MSAQKDLSKYTHETVPTEFIEAAGTRYAYRRFGKVGKTPLLLIGFFNSNLDAWDPILTNNLAKDYELILFDNAGVGASGGKTPSTVVEMTRDTLAFCRAVTLKELVVVGFSLGGMIAQQMAIEQPKLVKRLVLLGTGPRGGEGMTFNELTAEEQADPVAFFLAAFFTKSEASRKAGFEYMKRTESRKENRDTPITHATAEAQIASIREWGSIPKIDRYTYLKDITQPVLIIHGNQDVVVMPINALILAQHLPNATLIIYSDSSHGTQSQHSELFLEHVRLFLNGRN